MTAVAPKALLITNFETLGSSGGLYSSPLTFGGRLRGIISVTDVAAADSDADIFHVAPIYSSWRINAIPIKNDAITAGTSYDLGLYTTAAVVVDVDAYGSAIDMSSARTTAYFDGLDEARDIALGAQQVYSDAAATTDSRKFYYASYTANTVGSAAGQIVTRFSYVDGR